MSSQMLQSMTGSNFLAYVKNISIRTDKDAILYDCITDTILDMSRRINSQESQKDIATTATITSLGQYQIALEANLSWPVSAVRILESNESYQLKKLSKPLFDQNYPWPADPVVDKNKPVDYCIFGNQIWLGPVPDKTTYVYEIVYISGITSVITGSTTAVLFTDLYREILRWGTLYRLYDGLENDSLAQKNLSLYENGIKGITRRESLVGSGNQTVKFNDL